MKLETYAAESRVVETHWWFAGRRRLFGRLITALGLAPDAPVLDVGTSSGTNLIMLRDLGFTRVTGLDASPEAVHWCAQRQLPPVILGDIAGMPFADGAFQLVTATDVLEHVPDEAPALAEISRVLAPGGHVLISVPAFPSLWGLQDEVSNHLRRYRRTGLLRLVRAAGLEVCSEFHFNWILFAPIWAVRRLMRFARPRVASENDINTPLVNTVLKALFALDLRLAPRLRLPFGVSLLVLARKPR
jgi:SAM-dependent methyltransferase